VPSVPFPLPTLPQVLIVDDTPFNIDIMKLMIESSCPTIKCDSVSSGEMAILQVGKRFIEGKEPYRLIFMDINMPPGIDGCEACSRIRLNH
jgi:CheY-like chemotaxis protein